MSDRGTADWAQKVLVGEPLIYAFPAKHVPALYGGSMDNPVAANGTHKLRLKFFQVNSGRAGFL